MKKRINTGFMLIAAIAIVVTAVSFLSDSGGTDI